MSPEQEKRFLGKREQALEDSFFARQNKVLLERMRVEKQHAAAREGLQQLTGMSDGVLLDRLVELEISPETWAAVSLVPLVEVAWADGQVQEKERRAVLSAAEANGIAASSPSYQLLENWLDHRPDSRLLAVWGEYIVDLCAELTVEERHALRKEVLGRAIAVAESAGGILGVMNKVSREEEIILDQLAKAFEDR